MGILTLFSGLSWGQFMMGYPSFSPQRILNKSNEEWYTDETRSRVSAIVPAGANDELHLDPNHSYGTWNIGDRVMLIQMRVNSAVAGGWFKEYTVANVSGNILEIASPVTGFVTMGGNAIVQAVKIPRYDVIRLDNVLVKCHPWDGFTGGVIAFSAGVTELNKTVISAAGCGYYPEYAPTQLGSGGIGGAGDITYTNSGGGVSSLYYRPCLSPEPSFINITDGTKGEDGEDGGMAGGAGNANQTYTGFYPGAPSYINHIAKMGEPGYYVPGFKGGDGGGGGGHGGKGGESGNNVTGSMGEPGEDGGQGGRPGGGARGGGIILIKTMYFDDMSFTNGEQGEMSGWLDASGESGEKGKNGVIGGKPGKGGLGGLGTIVGSDVYYSGANGGHGAVGTPSGGGDGSYGGKAGTIFLYLNPPAGTQAFNFQTVVPNALYGLGIDTNWVNLKSGRNGVGGHGAYGYLPDLNIIQYPDGVGLPGSSYDYCESPPVSGQHNKYCDCDKAFEPFKYEYTNVMGGITNTDFEIEQNLWKSWYDTLSGTLVTRKNLGDDAYNYYYCHFHTKEDAKMVFKVLMTSSSNTEVLTRFKGKIDLTKTTETVISANHFIYNFKDLGSKITCMQYVSNQDDGEKYMDFFMADTPYYWVKIDTTRCHALYPDGLGLDTGAMGQSIAEPVLDVSFYDHFWLNQMVPSIIPGRDNSKPAHTVSYHQGLETIVITAIATDNKDNSVIMGEQLVELYDINGRILLKKSFVGTQYQIPAREFATGIYLLRITANGDINTYKIKID